MQPPKRALRFLQWFCRDDYIEEIEGDLTELFERAYESHPRKAKRQFIWNVLRSFRPRNLKINIPTLTTIDMYKNYLKIAFRVFQREKSFTLINVLGLATGLAITLLIIQYARFELSYESMHEKADRIVRLTIDYLDGETVVAQDCETYPPLGPRIHADFPEVELYTRAYGIDDAIVKVEEETWLQGKIYAADSTFFSIFDYPLIYGDEAHIFDQPFQIVLTEGTAYKYFGRIDVIGEIVEIPMDEVTATLKIVGVMPDSPPNTHLKVEMLISYATMEHFGESDDNWNGNNTFTYLLLALNTDYELFTSKLVDFNQKLRAEEKMESERAIGQKISDIHLYSKKTFEPEPNGDAASVFFLLGVAFLVIISAFVNYINLTTSKALDRAKEVGIRKVIGSTKGQLRAQFMTEAFLINAFAGIVALGFIWLIKTQFIQVAGLPESFPIFGDILFWQMLAGFIFLGIFCSGAYPAFVLSSFKPVSVLKGKYAHSKSGTFLRKGLVIFQFAVTIILLVQTLTVYEQLNFMRDKDLGVNMDQTLVVRAPAQDTIKKNYSTFKQQLINQAQVKTVSLSGSVPGLPSSDMNTTTGINLTEIIEDHNYNFHLTGIDEHYLPLMEIDLVAGKNFTENSGNGVREVIVNEEAIRLWSIQNPEEAVGKNIKFWGETWMIKGVMQNYHHESAKSAFFPIIHYYNGGFHSYASIRFSGGSPKERVAQIEKMFKANFPYTPFSYFFLDSNYDQQFKADERFQRVFSVLTGFAILIACLGLFGLASFMISKRTKEIGIRKVIGASTANILVLLSQDFIKTVLIAMLIGIPATYMIISNWLNSFAFRIEISWWLFVVPALLVLILVMLSLSVKTVKTALSNPVDSLRDE